MFRKQKRSSQHAFSWKAQNTSPFLNKLQAKLMCRTFVTMRRDSFMHTTPDGGIADHSSDALLNNDNNNNNNERTSKAPFHVKHAQMR